MNISINGQPTQGSKNTGAGPAAAIAPAAGQGTRDGADAPVTVDSRPAPEAAPVRDPVAATAVVATLFAHLMGATAAADTGSAEPVRTSTEDQPDSDSTETAAEPAATADPASLLLAMTSSLYGAPVPAPAVAQAASAAAYAASGAVAGVTLHPAASTFNLQAATIAVTPPADAAQQAQRAAAANPTALSTAYEDASAVTAAAAQVAASAAAPTRQSAEPMPATVPATITAAAAPPPTTTAPAPVMMAAAAPAATRFAAPATAHDAAPVVPMAADSSSPTGTRTDTAQARATASAALAGTINTDAATLAGVAPQPAAGGPANAGLVKLAGAPEQWQQPLREALGDRLQVNLQRNHNQAVIRLDPPNMGSIEISIRQSAGALQVTLSASNSEVVRQLNAIGDTVRQDLSTRQASEVAVTVSTARAQSQAQHDGGARQQREQQEQERGRNPGRALQQDDAATNFAMNDQE